MPEHYVEIYAARVMRGNVETVFQIGKMAGTNKYRVSINPEGERGTSVDLTFDSLAECFTAVQTHNAGDGDQPE